jgi:hypothetical protein
VGVTIVGLLIAIVMIAVANCACGSDPHAPTITTDQGANAPSYEPALSRDGLIPQREIAPETKESQIHVTVTDENGRAIAAATVYCVAGQMRAYRPSQVIAKTRVDESGRAVLRRGDMVGVECMIATAPGYVSATAAIGRELSARYELRMASGSTLTLVARTSAKHPLAGAQFVVSQVPADSTAFEDGGIPSDTIPGATRELAAYAATTNEAGEAKIDGLVAGTYYVVPSDPSMALLGPGCLAIASRSNVVAEYTAAQVYACALSPVNCEVTKAFLVVDGDDRPDSFMECRASWRSVLSKQLSTSAKHVMVAVIANPSVANVHVLTAELAVTTRYQPEQRFRVELRRPQELSDTIPIYETSIGRDSLVSVGFDCDGPGIDDKYKKGITFTLRSAKPTSPGDPGHVYEIPCGQRVDVLPGKYSLLSNPTAHMASFGLRLGHRIEIEEAGVTVFTVKKRVVVKRIRVALAGKPGFSGEVTTSIKSPGRSETFMWKSLPPQGMEVGFFEGESGTVTGRVDGLQPVVVKFGPDDHEINLVFE